MFDLSYLRDRLYAALATRYEAYEVLQRSRVDEAHESEDATEFEGLPTVQGPFSVGQLEGEPEEEEEEWETSRRMEEWETPQETAYREWETSCRAVDVALLLYAAGQTDDEGYRAFLLDSLGTLDDTEEMASELLFYLEEREGKTALELEIRALVYFLALASGASQEDVDPAYQWFLEPIHPVEDPAEDWPSPETIVLSRYDRLRR